uniref:Secreted protein n=2 Tax=Globodera pallida TaxID=36090 RepID=A0A183BQW0_GLOPA
MQILNYFLLLLLVALISVEGSPFLHSEEQLKGLLKNGDDQQQNKQLLLGLTQTVPLVPMSPADRKQNGALELAIDWLNVPEFPGLLDVPISPNVAYELDLLSLNNLMDKIFVCLQDDYMETKTNFTDKQGHSTFDPTGQILRLMACTKHQHAYRIKTPLITPPVFRVYYGTRACRNQILLGAQHALSLLRTECLANGMNDSASVYAKYCPDGINHH